MEELRIQKQESLCFPPPALPYTAFISSWAEEVWGGVKAPPPGPQILV